MDLPRPIAAFRPPDQKGLDRQRPGAIARIPARTVQKQILAIFETEKRQCDEIALPRLAAEQDREMDRHVAEPVRHGPRSHPRASPRAAGPARPSDSRGKSGEEP